MTTSSELRARGRGHFEAAAITFIIGFGNILVLGFFKFGTDEFVVGMLLVAGIGIMQVIAGLMRYWRARRWGPK